MTASIRVLSNDRITVSGAGRSNDGVTMNLNDQEIASVSVDWSGYLGADTIESVENDVTGATLTDEDNTTTTAEFLAQASGEAVIRQRVTTAAGQIKELPIYINGGQLYARPRDYC